LKRKDDLYDFHKPCLEESEQNRKAFVTSELKLLIKHKEGVLKAEQILLVEFFREVEKHMTNNRIVYFVEKCRSYCAEIKDNPSFPKYFETFAGTGSSLFSC